MKCKPLIITIMFLAMVSIAVAVNICEDVLTPGTNCTMLTPSLTCSTNYTIYNETDRVRSANMTLLNDSIYFFTFNETYGDYIVKLCDNSTREIVVETQDDNMIFLTIGIIYIFFTGLLVTGMYFANHNWIRVLLSVAMAILITTLTRLAVWFVSITYPSELGLISTLERFYGFSVTGLWIIITFSVFFLLIYIFVVIKASLNKKRRETGLDDWAEQ